MRLAVMPRTRERSEWSGHGVDGQTAPAKPRPRTQGQKQGAAQEARGRTAVSSDRRREPLRTLRDTSR